MSCLRVFLPRPAEKGSKWYQKIHSLTDDESKYLKLLLSAKITEKNHATLEVERVEVDQLLFSDLTD